MPGSFDCFCCPHTSVHRPSIACLAVFLCGPRALFLHALSGPSTICPFPPHGWSAPDGLPLLLRKQPIWAAGDTPRGYRSRSPLSRGLRQTCECCGGHLPRDSGRELTGINRTWGSAYLSARRTYRLGVLSAGRSAGRKYGLIRHPPLVLAEKMAEGTAVLSAGRRYGLIRHPPL